MFKIRKQFAKIDVQAENQNLLLRAVQSQWHVISNNIIFNKRNIANEQETNHLKVRININPTVKCFWRMISLPN